MVASRVVPRAAATVPIFQRGKILYTFPAGLSEFLPTDIDGCVLWLKSDTDLTVVGGLATSWLDQSDSGFTAAETGVDPPPKYTAAHASFGNYPTVNFEGWPGFESGPDFLRLDKGGIDVRGITFITAYRINPVHEWTCEVFFLHSAADFGIRYYPDEKTVACLGWGVEGLVDLGDGPAILSFQIDANNNEILIYKNGVLVETLDVFGEVVWEDPTPGTDLFINDFDQNKGISTPEIIVYDSFIDPEDHAAVVDYLKDRYNI